MSQARTSSPRGRLRDDSGKPSTRSSSLRRRVSGINPADNTTPTAKQTQQSDDPPSSHGLTEELRKLAQIARQRPEPSPQGRLTGELRDLAQSLGKQAAAITPSRKTNAASNTPRFSGGPRSAGKRTATATTPLAKLAWRNTPRRNRQSGVRRRSRGFGQEDGDLMDTLRDLARATAGRSQPFVPTPQQPNILKKGESSAKSTRRAGVRLEWDDNASSDSDTEKPPRISIGSTKALSELGYDSEGERISDEEDLSPPRERSLPLPSLSPGHSPERARRAVSERPFNLRESLGIRLSDRFDILNQDDSSIQLQNETQMSLEDEHHRLAMEEGDSILPGTDIGDQSMLPDDLTSVQISPVRGYDDSGFEYGEHTGDIPLPIDEADETMTREIPLPADDADVTITRELLPPELEDDAEDYELAPEVQSSRKMDTRKRTRKQLPISQYGIAYPSLPPATIKKLAKGLSQTKLSSDALKAIASASESFFEQMGDDLGAIARHAGRKTIEESDVVQALKRQRQINERSSVFSLAVKHLPHELLEHIRIQVEPKNVPRKRRKVSE